MITEELRECYNLTLIAAALSDDCKTRFQCMDLDCNSCPLKGTCTEDSMRMFFDDWQRWWYKVSEHADHDKRTIIDIIDKVKHALAKQDRQQYIR
uniref:Uncharacterized protein n=1 Tax=Myoviridae sp. ctj3P51 TaxID=2826687 RepID=A0A8S5NP82_9CAUD|nr:MAG TPA: hypothetical protein [Myoviridae sp. ctj3P51]